MTYNKLVVGNLSINNGEWSFEYSEEFKNQSDILPLSNFPEKNMVYLSKELCPFFARWIPSTAKLERKAVAQIKLLIV